MVARPEWVYSQFQKTGRKPSKTRRLAWSRGFSGLIYALDTESPARPGTTPTLNPRGRNRGAGKGFEESKDYGRLARSDEYSSGVAVPGSESGHALQVRRGTTN